MRQDVAFPRAAAPPVLWIPAAVTQHGRRFVPARPLYPLSRDHLIPLIEYNLIRASLTNILILGHLQLLQTSSCRFGEHVPVFPRPCRDDDRNIPKSLTPTPLQRRTPHPAWIDLFPSPRMRDNAIRAQDRFSIVELRADLMSGMCAEYGRESRRDEHSPGSGGLLVWSNPWEPGGWEVTEGFIRKWGFLVEGCTDLFEATDRWRAMRGQDSLQLHLLLLDNSQSHNSHDRL